MKSLFKQFDVLISTEFMYVMFLFSGAFKEAVGLPIDIGNLFLILTVLSTLKMNLKKKGIKKHQLIFLSFLAVIVSIILVNITYHGLTATTLDKLVRFVLLTIPTIGLPVFFLKSKESLKRILKSIIIISSLIAYFSLPLLGGNESGFVGFGDAGYLSLGRIMATGFITSFYFLTNTKDNKKYIYFFTMLLMGFILLTTGSRMPLIALILTVAYIMIKSIRITKKDIYIKKSLFLIVSLAVVFMFISIYLVQQGYFTTLIFRLQLLFTSNGGASASGRTTRFVSAVDMFVNYPIIGGGFGQFEKFYRGTSGIYPHNIILEFLAELGIIGLAWFTIFMATVIFCATTLYKKYNGVIDSSQFTLITLLFYYFVNILVSGDINENRVFFAFCGILFVSPFLIVKNNQSKKIINQ